MNTRTQTDFSILKTDFDAASKQCAKKMAASMSIDNPTNEEKKEFLKNSRDFLTAFKNNKRREKKLAILFNAALKGNIKTLENAFSQGIDINILNLGGNTLASYAVAGNRIKTFNYLVKKGADITLKGKFGYSPVEHAIMYDRLGLFKKLDNLGAISSQTEDLAEEWHASKIQSFLNNKK